MLIKEANLRKLKILRHTQTHLYNFISISLGCLLAIARLSNIRVVALVNECCVPLVSDDSMEENGDEGDSIVRIHYSWYHLGGPLTLLIFTVKCCNPNMLTSVAILFVAACGFWFYNQDDMYI